MLLAFVLAPALAWADVPPPLARPSPVFECGAKDTQTEMNVCASDVAKAQDRQLDAAARRYRKRLDPNQMRAFDASQEAWVTLRKRWCDFHSSGVEGRSVYPYAYAVCLSTMTEAQIRDLEYLETCEEGDLSCPAPRNRE